MRATGLVTQHSRNLHRSPRASRGPGEQSSPNWNDDPFEGLHECVSLQACNRYQEICGEHHRTIYCYRVISGAASRSVIQPDGRRRILDLLLPGDFFGLSETNGHDSIVESIVEGSILARYPRHRVMALAMSDEATSLRLGGLAAEARRRLETQVLILGRTTAREKVGAFLLELSSRVRKTSRDGFAIPISRYDIADYLGLSVETVSRSLSGLRQSGAIKFSGTREVRILDQDRLVEGASA